MLSTLLLAALLQVPPPAEEEIHVDEVINVELQQLYVTVTRGVGAGAPVLDLTAADFEILDDGEPQTVSTFARGDLALSAVLLLDGSASMEGDRLRTAADGAKAFISRVLPQDEVSVMLFSDELLMRTPFSNDAATLLAPVSGVKARGGSAINDNLYVALKELEGRLGRKVVILLSDGVDIESTLGMDDVRWAARRSQTLIYWIRLQDETRGRIERSSSWRDRRGHDEQLSQLEAAVAESGGRVEVIPDVGQVGAALQRILRELREQYVLGFQPAKDRNDGSWHKVEVRVRDGQGRARTRDGYVDR
ncbi:MAG: VWA domain-containing protein [Acidobacteriota bacterium]